MKALNEYNSLSEYIADCQRENAVKHEIPYEVKKEMLGNKQNNEPKKQKGLLGEIINLLLAPFRR